MTQVVVFRTAPSNSERGTTFEELMAGEQIACASRSADHISREGGVERM